MLVQMAVFALGTGIIISSLTIKYHDFAYFISFGAQMWMYETPIVYSILQVPQKWCWVYAISSIYSILETFRYAFLGSGGMNMAQIVVSAGITVLLFLRVSFYSVE
jgi:lipopolysaccharide transport system permease protein